MVYNPTLPELDKALGDGPVATANTIAPMLQLIEAADLLKGAARYVPAKVTDWHQRQGALVVEIEKETGTNI